MGVYPEHHCVDNLDIHWNPETVMGLACSIDTGDLD